eukprot:1008250-Rhodomonas_salina.2
MYGGRPAPALMSSSMIWQHPARALSVPRIAHRLRTPRLWLRAVRPRVLASQRACRELAV